MNMASCESRLWDLVRSIEPTPTQKKGAVRSQNYLRDILNTGQMAPRIIESHLSGSYARDTAIWPLDDVDIIFLIDKSSWPGSFDWFFGRSNYPDPAAVLSTFANAIRYRYPVSSVFGQRRSVRLQLYHLDIDVVPAIRIPGDERTIVIPDSNAKKWIESSPKRHSENAKSVNNFQNSQFKPLVKLLKYWNGNLPSTASMKSFAIETMAVTVFRNFRFNTLQDGLRFFFDFIALVSDSRTTFTWKDRYGVSLYWLNRTLMDAAGTGHNILDGIPAERVSRFVQYALASRDRMDEAHAANSVETACRRVLAALRA